MRIADPISTRAIDVDKIAAAIALAVTVPLGRAVALPDRADPAPIAHGGIAKVAHLADARCAVAGIPCAARLASGYEAEKWRFEAATGTGRLVAGLMRAASRVE